MKTVRFGIVGYGIWGVCLIVNLVDDWSVFGGFVFLSLVCLFYVVLSIVIGGLPINESVGFLFLNVTGMRQPAG